MKILFLMPAKTGPMDGWKRYTSDLIEGLSVDHEIVLEESFRNPLVYLKNPILLLLDAGKVCRAIRTHKPDFVHITIEPYALFFAFIRPTTKLILTVHGSYSYLPAVVSWMWSPLYKALYGTALRRIDTIIAVSKYTKAYLLRMLQTANLSELGKIVRVVHNGINVGSIDFVAAPPAKERKIILTVAPVKRRKGIIESLRAVARYKEVYHDPIEYRIVGSYDPQSAYGKQVTNEVAHLGLSNAVTFVGRVSEEKLQQEYASADLFLMLPIVNEPYFEGFGLVYHEANAAGLHVIGSKEGGSAEAINDGVSGYLVASTDTVKIAEHMHASLEEGKIDRAAARAWAEAHDLPIFTGKTSEIYNQ